jgi:hypothetical protein
MILVLASLSFFPAFSNTKDISFFADHKIGSIFFDLLDFVHNCLIFVWIGFLMQGIL